jgi:murein DD-endopeptidase MepM/ murein hydrolase activator NlpD
VDIAAPSGTPIKAAKAGQVLFTGSMPNLGKMVWIDHGQGFVTLYAHTSENLVSMGDRVKKSQTIALVGDTGKAEDPRLHFQLRHNGQAVDPREYLPPVEGNRVD